MFPKQTTGTKMVPLMEYEKYFAEIIISNFEMLKKGEYTLLELMIRTMGEQLIEDGTLLSIDRIVFDQTEQVIHIEYRVPEITPGAYLPISNRAMDFSWKNLTKELIEKREFINPNTQNGREVR